MQVDEPKTTFEPAPARTHLAICVKLIDLGVQENTFKGETMRQHQAMLTWELPRNRTSFDRRNYRRRGALLERRHEMEMNAEAREHLDRVVAYRWDAERKGYENDPGPHVPEPEGIVKRGRKMRMQRYRNILFDLAETIEAFESGRDWRQEIEMICNEFAAAEGEIEQQPAPRNPNVVRPKSKKETGQHNADRLFEEYLSKTDDELAAMQAGGVPAPPATIKKPLNPAPSIPKAIATLKR